MPTFDKTYDVIVVGAGHAGCEAALAAARMGHPTMLLTINLDHIAAMSCNPAVGGLAKGHLVKEIDAMGGEIARNADETGIQFRRLNTRKGLAVQSSRSQNDRDLYRKRMKSVVEAQANLDLRQAMVDRLLVKDGKIYAQGPPEALITKAHIQQVFGADVDIRDNARSGLPEISLIPQIEGQP